MNEHIEEYLDYYIGLETPAYAILLRGKWGSGKSWFIKDFIKKELKKNLFMSACMGNIIIIMLARASHVAVRMSLTEHSQSRSNDKLNASKKKTPEVTSGWKIFLPTFFCFIFSKLFVCIYIF